MKYLIVGLGNVGDEYHETRHNIGFMILDAFAKASNIAFHTKRSTFMNLSGNAVRYWMEQEKIPMENVLILVDDLALPLGTIRIKGKGSDAGHNGLKNIAQMIGTQNYARLRFGIGNDFPRGMQVDFVLSRFSPEEKKILTERIDIAIEAMKSFVLSGLSFAMNNFNNK